MSLCVDCLIKEEPNWLRRYWRMWWGLALYGLAVFHLPVGWVAIFLQASFFLALFPLTLWPLIAAQRSANERKDIFHG
ncbi:MAG: hypothetical protein C0510_00355 [Erythrobacter sp.]|nr:hypothetical protein [Erythrobacter sp.]MBA4163076.1 hypothetical protein [Erythrobacter sp.]